MTAILKNRIANAAGTNIADVNASGQLSVISTPSGTQTVSVSNFPATQPVTGTFFQATQPVSAVSLPLPTGAATETTVATLLTDTQLRATPVPVSGTISTGGLTDTQLRATAVPVSLTSTTITNFPATQAVSGTVTANLGTIAGVSTETTLSALNTKIPSNLTVTATRLLTDSSGVTQPISASALPLPTGASTSALQTTGNTSLSSIDTKIPSNLTVTATRLLVDGSGVTQPVSLASVPLPTGAATAALQTTGNTALATLDTSVNTLLKPASTLAAVTTVGTVSAVTAITNALPTGTNTIGNTNQTLSTAEFAKITDGTNTMTVKAASTAPVVADIAAVVTLSPNVSTVATALAKAEDNPHVSGDVGISALGVRTDTLVAQTNANGDYGYKSIDSAGRQIMAPMAPRSSLIHAYVNLTTTTETALIPAAAGFFNDIVNVTVSNNGAGNEVITFRSGTAGTILFTLSSLANDARTQSFNVPIPATAVNLPITVQMNAAAATGVGVSITAIRNIA